ncbi:uncharacterized protein AUP68_17300 [Ilyonectria robusta]
MDRNHELGAIASNVQAVLRSFHNLAHPVASDAASPSIDPLLTKFEDEMTRFKMWAGNLGAHQAGRASLDHRLREAPHLQESVIYLLKDLSESLQDAVAMAAHEQPSWHKTPPPNADEGNTKALDDSSDSGFTDSEEEDISPEARLSTICTDVGEAIDCLLRLSVAIANPAPHERVRKLGTGPSEDVSFYETHDINYVRDKFPKMSDELASILGKSITRRRQFFKYREAHHTRLAEGLEAMALDTEVDTSRTEIVPKTVASSLPDHLKKLTNFDLRTDVIDEDGRSEMGMSQTSYATSAGFLAEDVDGKMQEPPPPLKVPPLPAAAERGSFECPFCYRMVSASSSAAWKRHVFGDLRPYTCLFSGCMESNMDFDRRHRWQLHVSQYHWRSWFCPFKCEGTFPSKIELAGHIGHQHMPNASEDQVNTATALGEKSASNESVNNCPLCAHAVVGLKPYVKHVGRHLEQLALHALPSLDDENSEDGGGSDEQNSAASEANFSDGNSSYAPSTSPSLRRRLDEPEAVFAEIALKRDDEVYPETERLGREFGTNESSGDGWEEAQHEHTTEGEQDAAEADGVTAQAAAIRGVENEEYELEVLKRKKDMKGTLSKEDMARVSLLSNLIALHRVAVNTPEEAEVDNSLAHHSSALDPQQPVSNDMISPMISMQTQMHQLSPKDTSKVTELALRMMSNASERTKAKHRAQVHQILPQHQREELQAQGKDLALWFYENQSLQLLETNTVQPELESLSPSEATMPQEQQQDGHTGFFISEGKRPVPTQSGQDIPIQLFANDNEAAAAAVLRKREAELEADLAYLEAMKAARIKRGEKDANSYDPFIHFLKGKNLDNELHLGISGSEVTDGVIMLDSSEHPLGVGRNLEELEARKAAEEEMEAQVMMRAMPEVEALSKFCPESTAEEVAQQEYERRLEDDLRRSGLDDSAIGAILTKERAQGRENKERILEGDVVPVVEVPRYMLQKGTEHETETHPDESKKEDERLPIKFKDAVGRKFSFPFHLCQTWQGMEALIKQAFLHVDVLGPHVEEGHYDIVGLNDEIILPSVWEKVIKPGWSLTMVMWPIISPKGKDKENTY